MTDSPDKMNLAMEIPLPSRHIFGIDTSENFKDFAFRTTRALIEADAIARELQFTRRLIACLLDQKGIPVVVSIEALRLEPFPLHAILDKTLTKQGFVCLRSNDI